MPWGLKRLVVVATLALAFSSTTPARAHVVQWETRQATRESLMVLFPTADPYGFHIKHHRFDDAQVRRLAAEGVVIDPAQRDATFYVAYDYNRSLLGVAVFLAPPPLAGADARPLRVGVAVDDRGVIRRVHLYQGNLGRYGQAFLDRLAGRDLSANFALDGVDLCPVDAMSDDCQRIAAAGREALVLMKIALGRPA